MSLIVLPVLAVVVRRYGKSLKRASQHMLESMSRLYKVLEETLESFKVVLAYNNARRHRLQFHRESKTYFRKALRVVQIDALTRPTTELFGMTAVFVALVPSDYLILRGTTSIWGLRLASAPMDVAELAVLYALLAGVLDPVRKLSSVYSRLKKSAAATDRVFALMDTRSAIHDPAQTARFHLGGQTIEFREVGYTYPKQEEAQVRHPAVRNVNLKVSAGDAIAVVGENGSGKSTLINMLPRFFDADDGAILIDDVDIRTVKLAELRSHIAVVTQETQLFDDTIYENIRYGKPRATHEEVEAAARLAHVDQFLAHLPDGFATRIGEKGARLSGGQRQRIALARAIIRDPAILILDEATSAIDAQSEQLIHETLGEIAKGRIVFIITHSVNNSILDVVNRILVMDAGQLIAYGPHEKVLAECPQYQRLYHAQSRSRAA